MLGKSFEYICNANIISTLDTIESYVLTFAYINFGCDRSEGSSESIATVVVSIATKLIFDVF